MGFLFSIAFFLLLGLFISAAFVLALLRSFFSLRRYKSPTSEKHTQTNSNRHEKQKVFSKTEGEYVDFEEMKGKAN